MRRGNITKLFPDKQYGKIKIKNGKEAHFNKNCLWDVRFDELDVGQEMEFEVQPTHNGLLAFEIRPRVK